MCTQHPDSVARLTAAEEVEEAVLSYLAFGCDEYMVDYEGKATPYSQPRDVVARALAEGLPLGEGFFVTVRIPNPALEDFERSMLAMEAAVLANSYAYAKAGVVPVRWIVLPMAEDLDTVSLVRRALDLKVRSLLALERGAGGVQLVPLVEDAVRQLEVGHVVRTFYRSMLREGQMLEEVRIFLGISDSAVRHGHAASAMALVRALSELDRMSREGEYRVLPIVGMGSPPFRGGLNSPALCEAEAAQYAGYGTATIQSAVRYDVSYSEFKRVREAVAGGALRRARGVEVDGGLVEAASRAYREFVAPFLDRVAEYAHHIPSTRDRVSWRIYGRRVEGGGRVVDVPRAIVYTAAWYLLGVPPTLLDAQFVEWAYRSDALDSVLRILPAMRAEWEHDSQFYSPKAAEARLGDRLVRAIDSALDALGIRPEPNDAYVRLLGSSPSQAQAMALARMRGFLG